MLALTGAILLMGCIEEKDGTDIYELKIVLINSNIQTDQADP